ncbi:hypothetical protein D3C80_684840 [compost metagenome]
MEAVGENKCHHAGDRECASEIAGKHQAPIAQDAFHCDPGAFVQQGQWGEHEHPGQQVEAHQVEHRETDREQHSAQQCRAGLHGDGNREHCRERKDCACHIAADQRVAGGHMHFGCAGIEHLGDEVGG